MSQHGTNQNTGEGCISLEEALERLSVIRSATGTPLTVGLSDDQLGSFLASHVELCEVIQRAVLAFESLEESEKNILQGSEQDAIALLQGSMLNFYAKDCVSPYVALVAQGPWIVTAYGRVVYDAGGYGMLGFGHNPEFLTNVLAQPQVMANVMTPQFAHERLCKLLRTKIGGRRPAGCPFDYFLFMNSGSEAMSVATRISDVNARELTDPGARYAGRKIRFLGFKGGFHGRTGRPAQASDSSRKAYMRMATFRDNEFLWTITPNSIAELHAVFERAEREGVFIECLFLEPVMGEGNPGLAVTPEFYRVARELTLQHGSMLVMDSIQAGLRTQGYLSVVDYPGFENLEAPDMESYSKALNAGQYPLSVLALTKRAFDFYSPGLYGNTMTANPRALEIGKVVLEQITPEISENIRSAGKLFVEKFSALQKRYPHDITKVQGTGLLVSVEFRTDIKVYGQASLEEALRIRGINVIHGGVNSLRFTPVFTITEAEVELLVNSVEQAMHNWLYA